jgi:glycogen synthase
MMAKGMKVLVVGDYPPPYGGVSVQVSVLRHLLSSMPGFTCRVLDIGKSRYQKRPECLSARNPVDFVWKLLFHALRQYTIHLHTNGHNLKSWMITLTCAAAGVLNRRKTVVSLGSGLAPDFMWKANRATRAFIKSALILVGVVICRNERAKNAMVGLGIPAKKIVILSGFYGVGIEGLRQVPSRIEEFLQSHSPIVGAVASVGPEYGIPLFVEAAIRLRSRYPHLGALLLGPGGIEDHDLNGDLLVTGELPREVVLGVMQRLDLFVRPTYFDGDSSSVREALALGVAVVASDTDFRPSGVMLFRRGDVRDLTEKITHVLDNGHRVSARSQPAESGSLERLLAIYEWLGKGARFRGDLA